MCSAREKEPPPQRFYEQGMPRRTSKVQKSHLVSLISLQRAAGFWLLKEVIDEVIKVDGASTPPVGVAADIWGTVLALVYLEVKYAAQEDEWELIASMGELISLSNLSFLYHHEMWIMCVCKVYLWDVRCPLFWYSTSSIFLRSKLLQSPCFCCTDLHTSIRGVVLLEFGGVVLTILLVAWSALLQDHHGMCMWILALCDSCVLV